MPELDKINRWVMKVDKLATSKQRRFLRILNGGAFIPRGITRGAIAVLIGKYPKVVITAARTKFKSMRPATKYMQALGNKLGYVFKGVNRAYAERYLGDFKRLDPTLFKIAKQELKGFTYDKK